MPNEAQNLKNPSTQWRRILAALTVFSVILASCGSDGSQDALESSILDAEDRNGVEYGASLDEWVDSAADSEANRQPSNGPTEGYQDVTWKDLLPPGNPDDEVSALFPGRLAGLEDGSAEAEAIYAEMQAEYEANSDALNSELDGTKVKLAGFVAPLNSDGDIVTEFLLVPYFGACIHVPAPPANQTILVNVDKANGLTMDETWGAVWVAGTITVDPVSTDLANATFTMTDAMSGVYEEF